MTGEDNYHTTTQKRHQIQQAGILN